MSWTDDEKRAALGLLARIAEGIDRVALAVDASTSPEAFERSIEIAYRTFETRGNEDAPVLTLHTDDDAPA